MRARWLKPGFFKNEDLAECSPYARLLFAGLWTMADRSGRLEDRPKRIKAELLPFDDEPIIPLLEELVRWGFIRRYQVEGVKLIWIPSFTKHQHCHKNERLSELPPHPNDTNTMQAPDEHGANTVQAPDEHGATPSYIPILRYSDSPINDHSGAGTEPQDQAETVSLEIQQIGEGYPPDRYDPGASEIAMKALAKRRQWPGMTRIQDDLHSRLQCHDWTKEGGRFVPMLSAYIAKRMWLNPIPGARDPTEAIPRGISDAEFERLRRGANA